MTIDFIKKHYKTVRTHGNFLLFNFLFDRQKGNISRDGVGTTMSSLPVYGLYDTTKNKLIYDDIRTWKVIGDYLILETKDYENLHWKLFNKTKKIFDCRYKTNNGYNFFNNNWGTKIYTDKMEFVAELKYHIIDAFQAFGNYYFRTISNKLIDKDENIICKDFFRLDKIITLKNKNYIIYRTSNNIIYALNTFTNKIRYIGSTFCILNNKIITHWNLKYISRISDYKDYTHVNYYINNRMPYIFLSKDWVGDPKTLMLYPFNNNIVFKNFIGKYDLVINLFQ